MKLWSDLSASAAALAASSCTVVVASSACRRATSVCRSSTSSGAVSCMFAGSFNFTAERSKNEGGNFRELLCSADDGN